MNARISFVFAAALVTAVPMLRAASPAMPAWGSVDDDEEKQAKIEKEQDLYEEGTDALDDHEWSRAVRAFDKVIRMEMAHAASATYFKATAQAEMGNRSDAVATLLELQRKYPQSKWAADAKKLELEIRQKVGEKIEPRHVDDEELKLMAINALAQNEPERAIPILEGIISGNQPMKFKEKALFVLSQSSSPRAMETLSRVAKNGPPELQSRAIRFLGISGGSRAREVLADIYNSSASTDVKKEVLKAYMISGDRAHLLQLAKGESNADLRAEAVMQLGVSGGRAELAELYNSEPTLEVKKRIIQAMFIGGNADKLNEIATTEQNLDLRVTAIRNLGLLGGGRTGPMLVSIYQSDARPDVRRAVINALFVQNNAKALVDLARQEKDKDLKHDIVQKLSIMHNKDATDYLMEFLRE
jgi:HEAT repeat protein